MKGKMLYRIIVKGRVQGVGFRWSTVREASRIGISGFVKNMPDGSVYIEAEGTQKELDEFIDWCRRGPGIGFVQSVDYDVCPPVDYKGFEVRY